MATFSSSGLLEIITTSGAQYTSQSKASAVTRKGIKVLPWGLKIGFPYPSGICNTSLSITILNWFVSFTGGSFTIPSKLFLIKTWLFLPSQSTLYPKLSLIIRKGT